MWVSPWDKGGKGQDRKKCEQDKSHSLLQPPRSDLQHLFCILLITNESLHIAHIQGEGVKHRYEFQEAGILDGPIKSNLPHSSKSALKTVMGYRHLDHLCRLVWRKAKKVGPGPQWDTFKWHSYVHVPTEDSA